MELSRSEVAGTSCAKAILWCCRFVRDLQTSPYSAEWLHVQISNEVAKGEQSNELLLTIATQDRNNDMSYVASRRSYANRHPIQAVTNIQVRAVPNGCHTISKRMQPRRHDHLFLAQ
jgi:hypothetical protein